MPMRIMSKLILAAICWGAALVHAAPEKLKPYILGNPQAGDMAQVVSLTKTALLANGFEVVGSYSPFPAATVIVATNDDLKAAASKAKNGGFGVAQRVAVTNVDGKLQISYVNPAYLGAAYGMGSLDTVFAKLRSALGNTLSFGSEEGMTAKQLAPGVYHYKMAMPYFDQIDLVGKLEDYQSAVETVEKNLALGLGGTKKVYRIDLPNEVSVFGIGIITGDGINSGAKDTDKEVLDIIDYKEYRSTAYLPYELMIKGSEIIALRGRYRIALHFPDTSMMGEHGFTKIMSSPIGIRHALEQVGGGGS
jgi:hypothetical protein